MECERSLRLAFEALGFSLLRSPAIKMSPLTLLSRSPANLARTTLLQVPSVAPPPDVSTRAVPDLLATQPIPGPIARALFADVLQIQWSVYGEGTRLFDGAREVIFELHDLVATETIPGNVQTYLDGTPLEAWRALAPDPEPLIILSTLAARRVRVRGIWPDAHELPPTDELRDILDEDIVESSDKRSLVLDAGDDFEPLVVGVSLASVREVLGELQLGDSTAPNRDGLVDIRWIPPRPRKASRRRPQAGSRSLDTLPIKREIEAGEVNIASEAKQTETSVERPPPNTVDRKVGAGFCDDRSVPLPETASLHPDAWYWLWCEIGEAPEGAIAGGVAVAEAAPGDAEIEVVVFTNPGGFVLEHTHGTLKLEGLRCSVVRTAGAPLLASPEVRRRRLFFRLKTPELPGWQKLRLNLYHAGLLIQSLDVGASVYVGEGPVRPMRCVTDYALSRRFDPTHVKSLGECGLSILVNDSPGLTHGFRFFGAGGEFTNSAALDATAVQSLLDRAREAMRFVAWGDKSEYQESRDQDLHDPSRPPVGLLKDLVPLAKAGFRIWDKIAGAFAGGSSEVEHLREAMRVPGTVQLALRESSTALLPLALIYDHRLDTQVQNLGSFALCDTFGQSPEVCFRGDCPNREQPRTICPSGFWGFRHSIGVPLGVGASSEICSVVPTAPLGALASAYAGEFALRDAHLARLESLFGVGRFEKKLTRSETVQALKKGDFQLLYFYCHGGIEDDSPYLLVGKDSEDPNRIARDTLRAESVSWATPRPLVIINGCHTTALEPAKAIDLVSGFLDTAHASGVVGTEITVFEPLAVSMGEALVSGLLKGTDLGTALRDARRQLLLGERPNVLGLVYVAFALASLSVVPAAHQ